MGSITDTRNAQDNLLRLERKCEDAEQARLDAAAAFNTLRTRLGGRAAGADRVELARLRAVYDGALALRNKAYDKYDEAVANY